MIGSGARCCGRYSRGSGSERGGLGSVHAGKSTSSRKMPKPRRTLAQVTVMSRALGRLSLVNLGMATRSCEARLKNLAKQRESQFTVGRHDDWSARKSDSATPGRVVMRKDEPRRINEAGNGVAADRLAELEKLFANLSTSLSNFPIDSSGEAIQETFKQLLIWFHLDCLSLWEFTGDESQIVFSCDRRGNSRSVLPLRTDAKYFRWATARLLRGETILARRGQELPETAQELREVFKRQRIRSWLAIPLRNHGMVYGALVLVAIREELSWTSHVATPLKLIANMVGKAMANTRCEQALQQAEIKLQESEYRFRKMADEAPVIIWMHGPNKELIYINQAGLNFSGLREKDYLGRKWLDHIHPDDLQGWRSYEKAFDSRQRFVLEYRRQNANGQYRWLSSSGWPRFLANGDFAGYIGISLDIHDRKKAEQGKRQLTDRLFRMQEKERSRIGRELHDDFAQRLALLTIRLQELECEPTLSANSIIQIAELRKQADQLCVDLTLFSHSLHSSFLDKWGLAAAVKNQCDEISRMHQVEVTCDIRDLPSTIDENVSLTMFRVLQEAVHNTIKHSHASAVSIELFNDQGEIQLRVIDNGIGFDPDLQTASKGLGLISMKERIELVGGTLSIKSKASGTQLKARVPIRNGTYRSEEMADAGATQIRAA
jgi:PAS domain S-box-containing protein